MWEAEDDQKVSISGEFDLDFETGSSVLARDISFQRGKNRASASEHYPCLFLQPAAPEHFPRKICGFRVNALTTKTRWFRIRR